VNERADIIAALDAAFDIDTSDDAWLARVAETLAPLVNDGLGTASYVVRRSSPARPHILRADDAWHIDLLHRVHAHATSDEMARTYDASTGVDSLSGLFGPRFFSSSSITRWILGSGLADSAAIQIGLGDRRLIVCNALREVAVLPQAMKRFGLTLSSRIEEAYRLREHLKESAARPVAVLTPDAKVVHAEGPVRSRTAREALQHAVIEGEKARASLRSTDPARAVELFEGLVTGRLTIVERFESDGRRYLVGYENPKAVAAIRALTPREREILERVARGEPVKQIAFDLDLTPAAVGAYLHTARRKTGLRSRAELVRWFRSR
jgi:DNA-binding CsgD family transcriptional regulator